MKSIDVRRLALAALFTALGVVVPQLFHMIGAGTVFLPMHIPVLLCGFICGKRYGAICGAIVPLISSVITGMPELYPQGVRMAFELCAYGFLTGLLYQRWNVFVSLIVAMLGGRLVSGAVYAVLLGLAGNSYTFRAFLTGSFVTGLPGIVLQLLLIPAVILLLERANLTRGGKKDQPRE